MRHCLVLAIMTLVLSLTACAAVPPVSIQGAASQADTLAKIKAGGDYLSSSLAKVRQAMATARTTAPELAAAIEAKVSPALARLQSAVAAYEAAVAAADAAGADSLWSTARAALSKVLGIAAEIVGPTLLTGLLGA